MNVNEAFPSKYIKASDLQGKGVAITIEKLLVEAIGEDKDERPVLYFVGGKKGLVLNKTNAAEIADQHGDEMDHWMGKQIELYPSRTQYLGKMVDCVRTRPVTPKGGVAPAPVGDDLDDEIPF